MSPDARNSIYVWVVVSAFMALLLIGSWLGVTPTTSPWLKDVSILVGVVAMGRFIYGLWQRRASNPKRPNRP